MELEVVMATWLLRMVCVAGLVCFGGCGDDDGDGAAGSGGDGGNSGTSAGSGAGEAGEAAMLTKAECLQMQASNTEVASACLDCTCAFQPYTTAQCDTACWSLLKCLGEHCNGHFEDFDCVNDNCSESLVESESEALLMVVTLAVAACGDECAFGADPGSGGSSGD